MRWSPERLGAPSGARANNRGPRPDRLRRNPGRDRRSGCAQRRQHLRPAGADGAVGSRVDSARIGRVAGLAGSSTRGAGGTGRHVGVDPGRGRRVDGRHGGLCGPGSAAPPLRQAPNRGTGAPAARRDACADVGPSGRTCRAAGGGCGGDDQRVDAPPDAGPLRAVPAAVTRRAAGRRPCRRAAGAPQHHQAPNSCGVAGHCCA